MKIKDFRDFENKKKQNKINNKKASNKVVKSQKATKNGSLRIKCM